MAELLQEFTSTGSKLFYHQEAMEALRNGKGVPVTTHAMITDRCNFKCSFCSVQYRNGDTLPFSTITGYLDQLLPLGLKSIILSGGGNPILWRDSAAGKDFNDLIDYLHGQGLEIGLITNGMPMKRYPCGRTSWKTVKPETLDKCTWIRISLSGWDHPQNSIDTPDINPDTTLLGGSYVFHDQYFCPEEPRHGSVSTEEDLIRMSLTPVKVVRAMDRLPQLKQQMKDWAEHYKPGYVRLLPNCLQPDLIQERAELLREIAQELDPKIFFVQQKPPRQPKRCLKGYGHLVLNCDGFTYPCDSTVLSQDANHKFGEQWRICHWTEVSKFYAEKIRPNVPNNICPGCVFADQVDMISAIADGMPTPLPSGPPPRHINFI